MIFDYCIWLTSEKNNELRKITKEFLPHVSIKTNLDSIKKAENFTKLMCINLPIIVDLDYMETTECNGFYALQINVNYSNKNKVKQPVWWPNRAHVSLLYKYHDPINEKEIKNVWNKINNKECIFDEIKIMRCNNHHTKWEEC